MKISRKITNIILGCGLLMSQAALANVIKEIISVQKHNCSVKLKNENGTINYENISTAIATFSHTWTETIPVEQRMKVQKQENESNISFSKVARQRTESNVYSSCLSMVMTKGLFMSPPEADELLLKTSKTSWIDICVKNSDGFVAVSTDHTVDLVKPRTEFFIIHRNIKDERLSLNNESARSLGTIEDNDEISGNFGKIQYSIHCNLEKGE